MADELTSAPPSTLSSPLLRPSSPAPSVSPSLALDAIPRLDRTVSTPTCSTFSTTSTRSRESRLSDGGNGVVKRRGYMRPQGTNFADSARNRDSVMSLGSIAHMQYYFARTGLLDGKGAQLAKGDMMQKKKQKSHSTGETGKENVEPSIALHDDFGLSALSLADGLESCAVSDSGYDRSVVESPTEIYEALEPWGSPAPPMLPPTVSTYKLKPSYTEPLPDLPVLRRELKEALQDACKVLEEAQKQVPPPPTTTSTATTIPSANGEDANASFYELQGLHLLDIMTLAIRAAKNYYTAHSDHARLYAIKSERHLRADLYQVLDVLKRMASRNFRGGMRVLELAAFLSWIESIDTLLKQELQIEQREAAERESWIWREGDWSGKEREREWLFLESFDAGSSSPDALPQWPEASASPADANAVEIPSDFLVALQDGQRLIRLHNALVARSKRKFGEIKSWHTDVAKPYRRAENLRYWAKAAELRFDVRLALPVQEIVHGESWRQFDDAVLKWSRKVREELLEEWATEEERAKPPKLKIEEEVPDDERTASQRFEEALAAE